jgi:hypothetical protein
MSHRHQTFALAGSDPARSSADAACWLIPVAFFAAGFAPIVALSIALFGQLPIHATAIAVVLPASAAAVVLVLHSSRPNGAVGYLWRYVGDGGGMGMAFAMIAPGIKRYMSIRKAAVAYGLVIWLCLMATLHGCPDPQRLMFVLTPVTLVMSLVGHLVYGLLLGVQVRT